MFLGSNNRVQRRTITDDLRYFFDVGSTTTRVFHGGTLILQEPSCIAIRSRTDEVVSVGTRAYQLLGKTTEQLKIVFPVQYGVVADVTAFEHLLQGISASFKQHKSIWEHIVGVSGKYAHLGSLTPQEKSVLHHSLGQTGLGRIALQNQILAAVAALQLADASGRSFCILDIGGQVSEVAIVTGSEVVAIKRLKWGGVQCTELIQEAILQKYECAVSWHTAEQVKKELGMVSVTGKIKNHKISIRGKHMLTQLGKTVVIQSEDLVPVCTQFAQEIVQAVRLVFGQAPTEVVTSCLEQGIFLVGGGSLLQGLPSYLQQQLATEVCLGDKPDQAVVQGLSLVP